MKKNQLKRPRIYKGILSEFNDNPDKYDKVVVSKKKKGIISKLNDDPQQKK